MAALLIAGNYAVNAQIGDVLANAPTVSFNDEKVGVAVGSVMQGAAQGFESELGIRYDVWKHLALAVNVQSGKGSSSLDTAGFSMQVRKSWDNYELYGTAGGRRNWSLNRWEAVAGVGARYRPFVDGLLSKTTLCVEQRVIGSEIKGKPSLETFAGISYSF